MKADELPTVGAIQAMLDRHMASVRELLGGRPREAMLTIADTAEELQIGRKTVEAMIARGEIVASQVGRQWRIRRQDLDAYLDATRNRETG